jgi:cytochrome c-type biogenesis protein CcmE
MLSEPAAPPSSAPIAPRRKRKVRLSFVIAGLAIAGAIAYLVFVNTGATAENYLTIAQVTACTSCSARDVRVAGTVANQPITHDASQTAHFTINDGAHTMPVVYGGTLPDTLRAGTQVVVEGRLVSGVFRADNVLAKCPSKFQAATPGAGN